MTAKKTLALRDNGMAFNPLEYTPEGEADEQHGDGIMVLKSLASNIEYSLVLALNQTMITFSK